MVNLRWLLLFALVTLVSLPYPAYTDSATAPTPIAVPTPTPIVISTPAVPMVGHLSLSVSIIDNLTPKPVLLTDFNITATGTNTTQTLRTDVAGTIEIDLSPGHYHIESAKPTVFSGQSYIWSKDFDITASSTTKFQWTDADATATAVAVSHVSDAGAVYAKVISGVVTVEGDRGQGSGFVVDKSGLIITCQHVVDGGRWAAVQFDRGIRLPAVIVEEDSAADVAVLAINPAAYSSFTPLPLADPTQGPLAQIGESVLAIGSPLHQDKILTTGIVSKIGNGVLISDVNINHGNSGGPLLNLDGKVIGITTFLDPGDPNGPGISGIVTIDQALPVLAKARQQLALTSSPVAELLPDIAQTPIPQDSLDSATMKSAHAYIDNGPKNFQTIITTPFFAAAAQNDYTASLMAEEHRRVSKRDQNGVKDELVHTPLHAWEQYGLHLFDPVVSVEIVPELKEKSSSSWFRALTAVANVMDSAVGHPENESQLPSAKLEYRDDFWDMALYRDDTLVHPLFRQRDSVTAIEDDEIATVRDVATGGVYYYDPSVFAPGATIRIYSRRESDINRWDVRTVPDKERQRIWDLFATYRATLDPSAQNVIVGLSSTIHTPPKAGAESSNTEIMAKYVADDVTPGTNGSSTPIVASTPQNVASASALIAPIVYTIVLNDGSNWAGTIDHQDQNFIYLKVSNGTKLIKKPQIASCTPPLP